MNKLAAIGVLVLVSTVPASATYLEFNGSFCLTAANSTCQAQGWNSGTCFTTRYVPQGFNNGGTTTNISLFQHDYAVNFVSPTASLIGQTFQPVTVTKVGSVGYEFTANMRFTSQSPVSPTTTTPFITIDGNMENWDGITGCTVGFKAAFTRCPGTFC
jgi:hypothetical protein